MVKSLKLILPLLFGSMFLVTCERDITADPDDAVSDYVENEEDYLIDTTDITTIFLNGNKVEISGSGASFNSNIITINSSGNYKVYGTLDDGQILVNTEDAETVKIVLDNATVNCSFDAPFYVAGAERAVLLLADNSINTFVDGSSYLSADANAAVYSTSDLVISGEGKLIVRGNYNDGIVSKDGLIINSGEYDITATDDGIRGKDYLIIHSGSFTVSAGGDALMSDNETSGAGYINIDTGRFLLSSGGDGIVAYNELLITDGEFDITCNGTASSSKALKTEVLMTINGGDYSIESSDDALHSNSDIQITSGNFSISTGDDGIHADNSLTVGGGNITISNCYEGLESKNITVNNGIVEIHSSDDGVNAADGSGTDGRPGSSSGSNMFYMKGGLVAVYANGDGVDVNGSVEMSGGTIIVHGPTSSNNGALDYDGSFKITGGEIAAAGSSGMAQAPGSSSALYSVLIYLSNTKTSGTLFNIKDEDGNSVVTFKPGKDYSSVVVSSPLFSAGDTYMIYTGGTASGTENYGLYENEVYSEGSLYDTFTITSITTTVGSSGGGGGPGGGPGWP